MIVETKFSVGDNLFVLHNNKVEKITIEYITTNISPRNTYISYKSLEKFEPTYSPMPGCKKYEIFLEVSEEKAFATKEELLKSL